MLALKHNDYDAYKGFFERYGFPFNISGSKYTTYDADVVQTFLIRIKAVILILNMLQAPSKIEYTLLHAFVLYLVFSDLAEIEPCTGEAVQSHRHYYKMLNESEERIAKLRDDFRNNRCDAYTNRFDTIYTGKNAVKIPGVGKSDDPGSIDFAEWEKYWVEKKDANALNHTWVEKIEERRTLSKLELYFMKDIENEKYHRMIDYFYHAPIISNSDIDTPDDPTLSEMGLGAAINKEFNAEIDQKLKAALVDVAKLVIKDEINYAVSRIKPDYDESTLSGKWLIPDLYSALYFSVFYMNSNAEIYRKCENPSCGKYFLVKTTNQRKKYCSQSCANAANQRVYRKRKAAK
jgi:hypothetical protein